MKTSPPFFLVTFALCSSSVSADIWAEREALEQITAKDLIVVWGRSLFVMDGTLTGTAQSASEQKVAGVTMRVRPMLPRCSSSARRSPVTR